MQITTIDWLCVNVAHLVKIIMILFPPIHSIVWFKNIRESDKIELPVFHGANASSNKAYQG